MIYHLRVARGGIILPSASSLIHLTSLDTFDERWIRLGSEYNVSRLVVHERPANPWNKSIPVPIDRLSEWKGSRLHLDLGSSSLPLLSEDSSFGDSLEELCVSTLSLDRVRFSHLFRRSGITLKKLEILSSSSFLSTSDPLSVSGRCCSCPILTHLGLSDVSCRNWNRIFDQPLNQVRSLRLRRVMNVESVFRFNPFPELRVAHFEDLEFSDSFVWKSESQFLEKLSLSLFTIHALSPYAFLDYYSKNYSRGLVSLEIQGRLGGVPVGDVTSATPVWSIPNVRSLQYLTPQQFFVFSEFPSRLEDLEMTCGNDSLDLYTHFLRESSWLQTSAVTVNLVNCPLDVLSAFTERVMIGVPIEKIIFAFSKNNLVMQGQEAENEDALFTMTFPFVATMERSLVERRVQECECDSFDHPNHVPVLLHLSQLSRVSRRRSKEGGVPQLDVASIRLNLLFRICKRTGWVTKMIYCKSSNGGRGSIPFDSVVEIPEKCPNCSIYHLLKLFHLHGEKMASRYFNDMRMILID